MQYLDQSVEEYLDTFKDPAAQDAAILDVAKQMLQGVEQVHNTKYIHRDIKPANFRVHQGKVFITDFGLVKMYVEENTRQHLQQNKNEQFKGGTPHFFSLMAH